MFEDADLDAALPFLVNAGIQNAGQTCSASSRILVHRRLYDEVRDRMGARYNGLWVGPALEDLDVGPLISARQKEIVEGFMGQAAGLDHVATGGWRQRHPRPAIMCCRLFWPAARPITFWPVTRFSAPCRC